MWFDLVFWLLLNIFPNATYIESAGLSHKDITTNMQTQNKTPYTTTWK